MNDETTETEYELDEDPALAIAELLGIINGSHVSRNDVHLLLDELMHTSAVDRLPEGEI